MSKVALFFEKMHKVFKNKAQRCSTPLRKLKSGISKILFGHCVTLGHSTQARKSDLLNPDQCDLV